MQTGGVGFYLSRLHDAFGRGKCVLAFATRNHIPTYITARVQVAITPSIRELVRVLTLIKSEGVKKQTIYQWDTLIAKLSGNRRNNCFL